MFVHAITHVALTMCSPTRGGRGRETAAGDLGSVDFGRVNALVQCVFVWKVKQPLAGRSLFPTIALACACRQLMKVLLVSGGFLDGLGLE